jgi:hypothetical protein
MKANHILLSLTGLIFTLVVSGCSTARGELSNTIPEITLEGTAWTLISFTTGQIESSPIGGTQIALILHPFDHHHAGV